MWVEVMPTPKLSASDLLEIDAICDRFESDWRTGSAPQIEQFLAFDGAKRARLLAELIHIDKACRAKQGTEQEISIYLNQFPDQASIVRELLESPSHQEEHVRAWRLEVREGPHQGLMRELVGQGQVMIGRGEENDVALPDDPRCSRSHARIDFTASWCRVTDTGSKNGVHVNGERTTGAFLRDGDALVIGRTRIQITVDRHEANPQLSTKNDPPVG